MSPTAPPNERSATSSTSHPSLEMDRSPTRRGKARPSAPHESSKSESEPPTLDEKQFRLLARRAQLLASDYGIGYLRGLRRRYFGAVFGTADEHAQWSRMGLDGYRVELGRGYRDGYEGREPQLKANCSE